MAELMIQSIRDVGADGSEQSQNNFKSLEEGVLSGSSVFAFLGMLGI
jgi:hypothetical protein